MCLQSLFLSLARKPVIPLPLKDINFNELLNGDIRVSFEPNYDDLTTVYNFNFLLTEANQPGRVVVRRQVRFVLLDFNYA